MVLVEECAPASDRSTDATSPREPVDADCDGGVDLQGEEQTGETALANGNAQPAEKEAAATDEDQVCVVSPLCSTLSCTLASQWGSQTSGEAQAAAAGMGTEVTQALVMERLKQLEVSSAAPERREAAKVRRRLLREVQTLVTDTKRPAEERLAELHQSFERQVGGCGRTLLSHTVMALTCTCTLLLCYSQYSGYQSDTYCFDQATPGLAGPRACEVGQRGAAAAPPALPGEEGPRHLCAALLLGQRALLPRRSTCI